MDKRSLRALVFFALFYISFGAYLWLIQERIIYQPGVRDFGQCDALPDAERVTFNGTRMYVRVTSSTPVAVLYHGNAGVACDRAFYAEFFTRAALSYVFVEYAGYANNGRRPSHTLIRTDVENVVAFLSSRGITDVVVVGESIGSGPASYHAALSPPKQLVLITPFTDLRALARTHYWYYPTSLLVTNAFDNTAALKGYQGKVLILHGAKDTVVPLILGQVLFDSLSGEKQMVVVDNAAHNDLFLFPQTTDALIRFLSSHRLHNASTSHTDMFPPQ